MDLLPRNVYVRIYAYYIYEYDVEDVKNIRPPIPACGKSGQIHENGSNSAQVHENGRQLISNGNSTM